MSEPPGLSQRTSLFRHRPFRLLFTTRIASNTANQMQAVAVGWYVYALTGSALALGLIGLVQFLPPLGLALVAGQIVDRHSRRLILIICYAIEVSVSLSLLVLATFFAHPTRVWPSAHQCDRAHLRGAGAAIAGAVDRAARNSDARRVGARLRRQDVATHRPGTRRAPLRARRRRRFRIVCVADRHRRHCLRATAKHSGSD